jgi:UDP-N-acetylmuramoyl-L-alanyl-D-glutamate--2,6-diaminopimelate ligase
MARPLQQLVISLPSFEPTQTISGINVEAVTADSRSVQPGSLFVAVPGLTVDGHQFIADAVARGAVAVVGSQPPDTWIPDTSLAIPYIRVKDSRLALAQLAAAYYDHPSRHLTLIGVTGTDGKTTTINLLYHVLESAGRRPGMITTVGAWVGAEALDTGLHVTTPDAVTVQRYLAQMIEARCDSAILETTSHGLAQGRVAACAFDVAVVTNVTHEHLDYHGSWEAYLDAKASLFRALARSDRKQASLGNSLPQQKVAVLNADDASYNRLRVIPADSHVSYGIEAAWADLQATGIRMGAEGCVFNLRTPAGSVTVETPLAGRFNIYNGLAAAAASLAVGVPLVTIVEGLATARPVHGRMEPIDRGQDFLVFVDFAHTPVSLARALEAVRAMTEGRVIAVFGSAGLRDVQKRHLMAATSVRKADVTILTAEDPRTEDLVEILAQMAAGARQAGGREGQDFHRVPDRVEAIYSAMKLAQSGDIVLVAGKGHERSMCFGVVEHPWLDGDVVIWALDRRLRQTSESPPYTLPTSTNLRHAP